MPHPPWGPEWVQVGSRTVDSSGNRESRDPHPRAATSKRPSPMVLNVATHAVKSANNAVLKE